MSEPDRRTYLGGPDVAAIVGVNPWQAPIDVWRFKTGRDEPVEQTERMRLGLLLEQPIADAYCEQTGRTVRRIGFVGHKRFPYLGGHPDRMIVGEPGILEAKASATTQGYSDDDVPAHVRVQCQWYMGLTGREWCDVALLAHMGLRTVRLDNDAELYEALVEAGVRFWNDHVVADVEPEPDGSESYRRHLAEKFPRSAEVELVATPEQALLVDELRAAEEARKAAEAHEVEMENRIRALMGEASVLVAPGGRISWKSQGPATRWKEVAEAIAVEWRPLDASRVIEEFVTRDKDGREGPRVMRKSWPKAMEEAA